MTHRFFVAGASMLLASALTTLTLAADAPTSPPPAPTAKPGTLGVVGKVGNIDPAKNTLTIVSSLGDESLIHFTPTTRRTLESKVITSSDFKVGDYVVARVHPQADGSFQAIYVNTKAVTPMPSVKPKETAPADKDKDKGKDKGKDK